MLKLRVFLVASLSLFPLYLSAQNSETNTLFGSGSDGKVGWYGAFETKFTELESSFGGVFLGGRGGVIFNSVSIGAAGYWLPKVKELKNPLPDEINPLPNNPLFYWNGGYGGLLFEYINSPHKLLHFTSSLLVGGAYIACEPRNYPEGFEDYPEFGSFVLEPGIGVELNVSQSFKLNLGISYRYAPGGIDFVFKDKIIAENSAFSGFSLNLALKFGSFN
jgi:hypothetical protein